MSRPLLAFNPRWTGVRRPDSGEALEFDCPRCPPRQPHTLHVEFTNPLDGGAAAPGALWTREGEDFKTLTISPSIEYRCWHGWVEDGQIINITEATHHGRDEKDQVVALSPRQVKRLREEGKLE